MKIDNKEYIDDQVAHVWDKVMIVEQKNNSALKEADEKLTLRLEAMNEVRDQLRTQKDTFISRNEHDGDINLVQQKLEGLQKLVYVGLGIWLLLQLVLGAIITLVIK